MGVERHDDLWAVCKRLPTDYTDYGGEIVRWADEDAAYPDCSCGCRWAVWLADPHNFDWLVCAKPNAPRSGLLTWEHQTGSVCFEEEEDN